MGIIGRIKKKVVSSIWHDRAIVPMVVPVEQDKSLAGKTALVTGGSGGIGLCVAEELARFGCHVVVAGTNEGKLKTIQEEHPLIDLSTALVDYRDIEVLRDQLSSVIKQYGPFDFFVSSVGVHTSDVDFRSISPDEFDRVMSINLRGTYFATKIVTEDMVNSNVRGKVVLITSSRGLEPAWSPYGISKWGLHGMTLGFAQLLARYGITVNAVAPGPTATSLIGLGKDDCIDSRENALGRIAVPEEVAALVRSVFIEGGDLITGEVLSVSGGRGRFELR